MSDICNMQNNKSITYFKIVIVLLFAWYFLGSAFSTEKWHFIDNVDLIIHEAGHWIFIFFGRFISILGGSLTQVTVPVIFALYFLIKKDFYSVSILSMWVGYNIVNVSVYMADSIKMALPLLGGESSVHDWNYLFGALHVLNQTNVIASTVNVLGVFIIITGAVFAVRICFLELSDTKRLNSPKAIDFE